MSKTYQISEVAAISGVSIRTLHYYDAIGLLVPDRRTGTGYRLYTNDDLLRLQQILIGRELGLSLDAIRRSLDDPKYDYRCALLEQRELLLRRAELTKEMLRAIDAALATIDHPETEDRIMADIKQFFNGFDHGQYEAETKQRWGGTDAYRISEQRTKSYTEKEWMRFRDEAGAIYADACAILKAGKLPEEAEAMDIAERHRLSIERWFYPCPAAMHRGLADMYEADHRFSDTIDRHGPGLTKFLAAAIHANAQRPVAGR